MSVTVGKYHLFQRKISTGTFYYYWYEHQGKRVHKSCGSKCETKRHNDLMNITLGEYATDMFIEGAPHLIRWAAKGRVLKRQTITHRPTERSMPDDQ